MDNLFLFQLKKKAEKFKFLALALIALAIIFAFLLFKSDSSAYRRQVVPEMPPAGPGDPYFIPPVD